MLRKKAVEKKLVAFTGFMTLVNAAEAKLVFGLAADMEYLYLARHAILPAAALSL